VRPRVSWETEFETAGGASIAEEWLNRLRDDQRGAGFALQLLLVALVLFLSRSLRPQIFDEAGFYVVMAGWVASIFITKIMADRRPGIAVKPVLLFAAWARGLVQVAGIVLTGGVRSPLLIALAAAISSVLPCSAAVSARNWPTSPCSGSLSWAACSSWTGATSSTCPSPGQ
jgi:hypothetical protein